MLPEYDFRDGVRGKHAEAYGQGHTVKIHHVDGTITVQVFPRPGVDATSSHTSQGLHEDEVDRPDLPFEETVLPLRTVRLWKCR